jgi:hypothetical protein
MEVDDVNGLVHHGLARVHGVLESAPLFANAGSKDFPALTADGFFFRDAGDFFGRAVKRGDLQVGIHGENAVCNTVQDDLRLIFSLMGHRGLRNIVLLLQRKVFLK